MSLNIVTETVKDEAAREGFKIVQDTWNQEPLLVSDFKHFEIAFTGAGTLLIAHGLGFTPTDVITTWNTAGATWNYDSFTSTDLSITVTGAGTVRAFIGAYKENT